MKEHIQTIKTKLHESFNSFSFFDQLYLPKRYVQQPLDQTIFNSIASKAMPISAVDGGMQPIVQGPNMSVSLIRVASYGQQKRQFDVFCIVTTKKNAFEIELLGVKDYDVTFPQFNSLARDDPILKNGGDFVPVQNVVSLIRRCLELWLASALKGVVVIDGSLECRHPFEKTFDITNCIGVSKSCSWQTREGYHIWQFLQQTAIQTSLHCWSTKPIAKVDNLNIGFAKLHERSSIIVRIDSFGDIVEAANMLAPRSIDATLLGYPYELVRADQVARVTNAQIQVYRTQLFSLLDPLLIHQLEHAQITVHDLLDSQQF